MQAPPVVADYLRSLCMDISSQQALVIQGKYFHVLHIGSADRFPKPQYLVFIPRPDAQVLAQFRALVQGFQAMGNGLALHFRGNDLLQRTQQQ